MERFNLDTWLQNKSCKVVTRDGRPVRILCIDCGVMESQPILAEITCGGNTKVLWYYNIDGTTQDKNLNLFFADEEELTEFEKELKAMIQDIERGDFTDGSFDFWKGRLLDLARKELLKDLPKWKKMPDDEPNDLIRMLATKKGTIIQNCKYYLDLDDLETLPKEE